MYAVDTVDITGGGGASAYFKDSAVAGTGTDGLNVRVGYFTTPANVSAYAYNLAWVNSNWNEFGIGTTQTLNSVAGSFDPNPNLSNASTAFRGQSLYIVSGDNGTLASSTNYGVYSTSTTFSSTNPYFTATDTSLVTAANFGTLNGTTSLNTAAKATTLYWDINGAAGLGGSGTWGNAVGNTTWTATSAGVAASGTHAWGDNTMAGTAGAGLKAVFDGTAGTVTVSGTVQANAGMDFKVTGYSVSGGTAVNLTGADAATNTITVDNGVTVNFTTDITGTNGITKAGAGELVVNGTVTLDGNKDLKLNAGTLKLGNNNRINSDTKLTLAGGTLATNGHDNTFTNLTLTADSVIDFGGGDGTSIIVFTDTTITFNELSPYTLKIYNWAGNPWQGGGNHQLIFSNDTTSMYSNIIYYTDAGSNLWSNVPGVSEGAIRLPNGEIAPVTPEPATWLMGSALLGITVLHYQRKVAKKNVSKLPNIVPS